MNYLKDSEKTMATQSEDQRKLEFGALLNLFTQAREAAQRLDLNKRGIFYNSSFEKLQDKLDEHIERLGKLNVLLDSYEERTLTQHEMNMFHAALGLFTEAGEIAEAVLESIITGTPVDNVNMKEEVGDLDWYEAIIARECGFTFEEAQDLNIQKLKKRYGDKFTSEAALERDLDGERKVLEG